MKRQFLTALLLGSMIVSASANDVYVSATGNDDNDGASAATAYATMGKALAAVEENGTVHVSGTLYTGTDIANVQDADLMGVGFVVNKTITVQGDDKATAILDGLDMVTFASARFFQVTGGTLTLKNLTMINGVGSGKGGAVHVNGGALVAENVVFDSNIAQANSGNPQPSGAAVHVDKTTGVSFKNCLFTANEAAKGGAFYIQDTQNTGVELRFEACSFVGNKSTQGGASCAGLFFRLMAESPTINILNCTFSANRNAGNGGMIYIYGAPASATFNIINTTIVDNVGQSGGGSGAGINVEVQTSEDRKPKLNILNSIIEGNAVADGTISEDLVYGYEPTAAQIRIANSFIGKVFVQGAGIIPADALADNIYFDYMLRAFDRIQMMSGVDAFDYEYNVYPLTEGAFALTEGSAAHLQPVGITTDQLGQTRAFANGRCSAGAVEGVGIPDGLGIGAAQVASEINIAQAGDVLTISTEESGLISVELISINGQSVAKTAGIGQLSISVGQLAGVYVARVVSAGAVYSQKVLIK
jgi:hypothetical protein